MEVNSTVHGMRTPKSAPIPVTEPARTSYPSERQPSGPGASQDDCGFLALRMSSAGPSESREDQAFRISGGCVPP
ncbi:hypothetical protein SAMN05428945_0030 [Streptomyces sp. 2224.1]|nr:hypothetical protein BX261_5402 [Streptomyces sp. 2321.6]SDR16062.1 hypothetical protein SAMN05216511_1859 [Streptomyces sp. KS_16]SEB48637.1 hypothetical protein SAMN05428945_0030 [Streptomyces sp. 2224.1]SED66560.1 hypothetical protein SAMN05428940_5428 [Streptomyces sp. 2133.1]SEE16445.1 hypothetical protein SAMN05428954_1936 [Streptomyces sp. 2112.3]SNC71623.1 hypothetical protein SAMN06272741_5329 [Streptomyces sp. 2114.4]